MSKTHDAKSAPKPLPEEMWPAELAVLMAYTPGLRITNAARAARYFAAAAHELLDQARHEPNGAERLMALFRRRAGGAASARSTKPRPWVVGTPSPAAVAPAAPPQSAWDAPGWRVFFFARAAIAELDGLPRDNAEAEAFEACVEEWLGRGQGGKREMAEGVLKAMGIRPPALDG